MWTIPVLSASSVMAGVRSQRLSDCSGRPQGPGARLFVVVWIIDVKPSDKRLLLALTVQLPPRYPPGIE